MMSGTESKRPVQAKSMTVVLELPSVDQRSSAAGLSLKQKNTEIIRTTVDAIGDADMRVNLVAQIKYTDGGSLWVDTMLLAGSFIGYYIDQLFDAQEELEQDLCIPIAVVVANPSDVISLREFVKGSAKTPRLEWDTTDGRSDKVAGSEPDVQSATLETPSRKYANTVGLRYIHAMDLESAVTTECDASKHCLPLRKIRIFFTVGLSSETQVAYDKFVNGEAFDQFRKPYTYALQTMKV
jgi:hypothetical protein